MGDRVAQVLGLVLGYLVESNFRRSLVLSGDDLMIFIDDRISLVLLLVALLFIAVSLGRRLLNIFRGDKGAVGNGSEEKS